MPKIKIDPADMAFSQWIRLRDGRCVRCGSTVRLNDKGLPISHTNSHYFGRAAKNTRWEPKNCDTLCYPCHVLWGSQYKKEYEAFKIAQLGEDGFDLLTVASNTYHKPDWKAERVYWRQRLTEDFGIG